jgi:tRNA nucleotidyltransferase/poly(A) polymerase
VPELVPEKQRRFAVEVVRRLRAAGFEAYWAGGCVRDQLLGRAPKDYDVATSAVPPEIREVFGRRRTVAVGAAFGVITVLGPREAGQIEVATFRRDAAYSDGRHPDSVTFSTAEEDASRRDFTINGLFYDPVDQRVIDFVGGQEDLDRKLIRAIGDARERFSEDKLRLLRGIRFSATFDFALEAETLAAIRQMAPQITVVSPERIAMEMRRMLVVPRRSTAIRLAVETGLASAILPEIVASDEPERRRLDLTLGVLDRLRQPGFPLALAALLIPVVDRAGARKVCKRWKLSNGETDRVGWLVEHHAALAEARSSRWSRVQKILIADCVDDLLALNEAAALAGDGDTSQINWCREKLSQPREVLDPTPLLSGDDLIEHGVPRGPVYRMLLERVRDAQLDGEIHDKTEALGLVDRLLNEERHSQD